VASAHFFFALECSGPGASSPLLAALAAQVLGQLGCTVDAVPELVEALQQAAASGRVDDGRCGVEFRAENGTLEILLLSSGRLLWQTSRAIP
jgi:hypothetical protein